MKNLTLLLLIGFILIYSPVFTQSKMLTMEEAIVGQWRQLYPEYLYGEWQPESNNFLQRETTKIESTNAKTNKKSTLLTLSDLNNALSKAKHDSIKYLPRFAWIDKENIYFKNKSISYTYNITNQTIKYTFTFEKGDSNFDEALSKSRRIAVTNKYSLYVITPNERITIATSDNEKMVYGQSVSRREFGISKGTFWSHDENKLAYYINDNSNVKQYPLVDITAREAEAEMISYPMAGMKSEHISLGVYNFDNNKTIFIEDNDKQSEKYLTNITWGPESKYIYIQVLNRAQDHMKLNQYDAEDGKLVKTLFEEKHNKYVEPLNKLLFLPKDNEKFIYQSRKDGFNHLYLYNINGELIKQLTNGNWEVTELLGFDNAGKNLFYQSTQVSPIERHTYSLNLKKDKISQLTREQGTHRSKISDNGEYIFDTYSSIEVPRIANILNLKKGKRTELLKAENPLKEYKLGEMKIGTIKAADDKTDLYYRLIKPANFDPNKKYPAIIYVYGGPHAQLINNTWLGGARMWQHYMAQNNYVVITIDNRGSANRGLEFENIIHRQCGKHEMEDQLKGVEFLNSLGYVDMKRIGIHGWSYGGFMTTSLITNHPEIFKVGVAGGPVIDWKYYEIMYGERYMDSPEENPEGYKSTSLIPMASKLKGDLLIIHGYMDPVVVIQHSLTFIRECISNNIPIDYFVYPRSEHNVRGKDRIHLMQKVTDYFEEKLK